MATTMELTTFAYSNGLSATQALSRDEQKLLGQFMTPPGVAVFMAQRCLPSGFQQEVRILDPAAGAGILAAAVVERLLQNEHLPERIQVTLYELDERLLPSLRKLAHRMRHLAKERGVVLSVSIRHEDFLLSTVASANKPIADVIIANPPYFKLSASDPRAVTHQYAVYGQPNIYGLFMAACAGLLSATGRWCFITPRSWTNGTYFSFVRRHLLRYLRIEAMHIFESRREHFADDEILQEAMITWAAAQAQPQFDIFVSSSEGLHDLAQAQLNRLPINRIVGQDDAQMIALPTNVPETLMAQWKATLGTYGLKVSTGPVIAFRAESHILEMATSSSVPLLWMQHINHMRICWPINKKREHIAANGKTAWMLIQNQTCIVMRRFSPKEDERRITAAPYLANTLPGSSLGLENHTNYIYRPGGEMSSNEARGLAAYLNSSWVDQFLRMTAGSTQINATDLRKLPLPPLDVIVAIGHALRNTDTLAAADAAVDAILETQTRAAMAA
jgi:adenine-specific DNA-methyltransferase